MKIGLHLLMLLLKIKGVGFLKHNVYLSITKVPHISHWQCSNKFNVNCGSATAESGSSHLVKLEAKAKWQRLFLYKT